ncbi:MAG: DUF1015 domain-containing protein [Synergistaceae bacterium]|nr:DUF1015 domain-containing protein [Synergistaceae bacterium]
MIHIFTSANFLLPDAEDLAKWAVIACDQFTSQPDYWEKVRDIAGNSPSAYNLILPEAMLNESGLQKIEQINAAMNSYLEQKIFTEYKDSYIYVERELLDGSIRRGVVGVIDLEEYDFREGRTPRIRATEETVKERIPARKIIRENAALELSHVILLCDDEKKNLIEPLTHSKHSMKKLYGFELMLGGGKINGWLINGEQARAFTTRMNAYIKRKSKELSLTFAVGDGNHSLAAAKSCYLDNPTELSRYAMVELENIHDDALKFEPIHRIVKGVNPEEFISEIQNNICVKGWTSSKNSWALNYYDHGRNGIIFVDKSKGASPLIVLQKYLDSKGCNIDYIHDTESLMKLADESDCVGFEMPPFDSNAKRDFFSVISQSGVLPRKTFSMGHAQEKRYYLEARRIK